MKNDWIVFKQPLINFSIFHFAGWRVAGASFLVAGCGHEFSCGLGAGYNTTSDSRDPSSANQMFPGVQKEIFGCGESNSLI